MRQAQTLLDRQNTAVSLEGLDHCPENWLQKFLEWLLKLSTKRSLRFLLCCKLSVCLTRHSLYRYPPLYESLLHHFTFRKDLHQYLFSPTKRNPKGIFTLQKKQLLSHKPFIKVKWCNLNFWKVGDTLPCILFQLMEGFIGTFYYWIIGETCIFFFFY